jgi:hypothetical protein
VHFHFSLLERVSFDVSSRSGSEYSADSLTSIGNNVPLRNGKMGYSTEVSSDQSSCCCPETWLRSSVSPNTNKKHVSRHI